MDTDLIIRDRGITDYQPLLAEQLELLAARQADNICNMVLLTEHRPVITLGARKSENKLLIDKSALDGKGIEVVAVGRGGGTTAHNPGQLVIYPIIKLKSLGLDIPKFVRQVEQVGIDLLDDLGVATGRRKGLPGLWINEQKIASVGIQLKKWVSMHGIAININNDLGIFDYIVPCGLNDVRMTSALEQTGKLYSMEDIKKTAAELCRKAFNREI